MIYYLVVFFIIIIAIIVLTNIKKYEYWTDFKPIFQRGRCSQNIACNKRKDPWSIYFRQFAYC